MSTYANLQVFLWHPNWGTDAVEVIVPDHWPEQELDKETLEGDFNFAQWVSDNTGLSCTVERNTKVTSP